MSHHLSNGCVCWSDPVVDKMYDLYVSHRRTILGQRRNLRGTRTEVVEYLVKSLRELFADCEGLTFEKVSNKLRKLDHDDPYGRKWGYFVLPNDKNTATPAPTAMPPAEAPKPVAASINSQDFEAALQLLLESSTQTNNLLSQMIEVNRSLYRELTGKKPVEDRDDKEEPASVVAITSNGCNGHTNGNAVLQPRYSQTIMAFRNSFGGSGMLILGGEAGMQQVDKIEKKLAVAIDWPETGYGKHHTSFYESAVAKLNPNEHQLVLVYAKASEHLLYKLALTEVRRINEKARRSVVLIRSLYSLSPEQIAAAFLSDA